MLTKDFKFQMLMNVLHWHILVNFTDMDSVCCLSCFKSNILWFQI